MTLFRSRVSRWMAAMPDIEVSPRAVASSMISAWRAEKCSRTPVGTATSSAMPLVTGPHSTPRLRESSARITASAIVPAVLAWA